MENKKLNFLFNIDDYQKESADSDNFLIRGVAINSTVTRNGHKFVAEELSKSAVTLQNKPILKDHKNTVDGIVGKTTNNVRYDDMTKSVLFEAKIVDRDMQKKISQGLISNVSVGAMVKNVEEDADTGETILRGIDFVELSLVAVPADPNAGFAKAICELLEQTKVEEKVEEIKMVEEVKPATVVETVAKAEFDAIKAQLDTILAEKAKVLEEAKKAEEKAKLEAEIRAKVEAELKEQAKPKAEISVEQKVEQDIVMMADEDGSYITSKKLGGI